MFRRLALVLVPVAVVAAGLSVTDAVAAPTRPTASDITVAPAKSAPRAWFPPAGVAFNDPVGSKKNRTLLVRRVIEAIKHTPRRQTIRIAAYSFDRKDVADALVRAHKRGVNVQIVLNDNWTSKQTVRLKKRLGKRVHAASFVKICHGSCRGGPGNLHMKVYSFSQTGAAKNVVMTGSANMTDRAVSLQWNDLYTVNNNAGLYNAFAKIFGQLKFDKKFRPRRLSYSDAGYDATFYKKLVGAQKIPATVTLSKLPGPNQDPVMQRLRDVKCTAVKGAGIKGKTVIRVMMYGWSGNRGKWLAQQLISLKRRGCNIMVILSVPGGQVVKMLAAAKITMKSADWKYIDDPEDKTSEPDEVGKQIVDFYNHMKVITINGTYKNKPVHTVWTGSENWSPMSFRNDELILQINNIATYRKYNARFSYMWSAKRSHRMGYHPTRKP